MADQRPDEKPELLELKSIKPPGSANDTTVLGRAGTSGVPESSVGGGGAAAAAAVLTQEDENEDEEEAPLPDAFEYHTDNEDDA